MLFEYVLKPDALLIDNNVKGLRRGLEYIKDSGVLLYNKNTKIRNNFKGIYGLIDELNQTEQELIINFLSAVFEGNDTVRSSGSLNNYDDLINSKSINEVIKHHEKCSLFIVHTEELDNFSSYKSNKCEITDLIDIDQSDTLMDLQDIRKKDNLIDSRCYSPEEIWHKWGFDLYSLYLLQKRNKPNISLMDAHCIKFLSSHKETSGIFNILKLLMKDETIKDIEVFFESHDQTGPEKIIDEMLFTLNNTKSGINHIKFYLSTPGKMEPHHRYIRFNKNKLIIDAGFETPFGTHKNKKDNSLIFYEYWEKFDSAFEKKCKNSNDKNHVDFFRCMNNKCDKTHDDKEKIY